MVRLIRNQEVDNRDKHPFLQGDNFERLVRHTSENNLMTAEEIQQLLARHEAIKATKEASDKRDLSVQIAEMKNNKSRLEKLKEGA